VSTEPGELHSIVQQRLINWGYAVCDAAMREWVVTGVNAHGQFPYAAAAVG
jgi:NTE family protein